MSSQIENDLRSKLVAVFEQQGYTVDDGMLKIDTTKKEKKREVQQLAKSERIFARKDYIINKSKIIKKHLLDGKQLEVDKIKPELIEVIADSKWETLFRWWNLVWWSLPYEHAYGRQMRYVVWDQYHKSPIGLIGLQSPILSWSVRDNHLGIPKESRDYWVNQSLSAQRLGALPPYNSILGGKLVSYLMTSDVVRKRFRQKYLGKQTVIQKRVLPARLLFITTTGAYGKSSIYNRLKLNNQNVAKFIGYTQGYGSFHIPNHLFLDLVNFLECEGYNVQRGYGSGPSRKLKLIDQALVLLGFKNGTVHGVKRATYLFPFVENLTDVIQKKQRPKWFHRSVPELTEFWKRRWALPRIQNRLSNMNFDSEEFVNRFLADLDHPNSSCTEK